MLFVAIGVVLAVSLLAVLRLVRHAASEATAKTARLVLEALYHKGKPLNVTEIMESVPSNSGLVINAIKFLHKQEMIASNAPVTNVQAALDNGRYYITSLGKDHLRRLRNTPS